MSPLHILTHLMDYVYNAGGHLDKVEFLRWKRYTQTFLYSTFDEVLYIPVCIVYESFFCAGHGSLFLCLNDNLIVYQMPKLEPPFLPSDEPQSLEFCPSSLITILSLIMRRHLSHAQNFFTKVWLWCICFAYCNNINPKAESYIQKSLVRKRPVFN